MQPATPRDFLKVALQRLNAAEEIMDELRLSLEAQYIGGYSVECLFKALIVEKTPPGTDRDDMYEKATHGENPHKPEFVLARLKEQGRCSHAGTCKANASLRLGDEAEIRDRA